MRAKLTVLLGTLVGAFVLLGEGAPALAHGNHHVTSSAAAAVAPMPAGDTAPAGAVAKSKAAGVDAQHELAATPGRPAKPQQQGNCCCSGALCQAGVAITNAPVGFCYSVCERVQLATVHVIVRDVTGGIERPPRQS